MAIQARNRVFSTSHLFASTGRPRFMAVFVGYFDASGDLEDPSTHVLSVAGWIAPEAKWRRLERAWKKICDREGVSGLHMKEFAHFQGEYRDWKGDELRRQKFLSDLAGVIHSHTNRDFSQSLFLDGYRAIDAQFRFHEHVGHPYAIGAWRCISKVREWMAKKHPSDDVLFVFEKGDAHQEDLIRLLRVDNIDLGIEPQFMKKRWKVGNVIRTVPALECADFMAYEQHKNLTDIYLKKRKRARGSLWALAGRGNHLGQHARRWSMLDGRFFESLVTAMKVPRRAGVPRSPIPHEFDMVEGIGPQLR